MYSLKIRDRRFQITLNPLIDGSCSKTVKWSARFFFFLSAMIDSPDPHITANSFLSLFLFFFAFYQSRLILPSPIFSWSLKWRERTRKKGLLCVGRIQRVIAIVIPQQPIVVAVVVVVVVSVRNTEVFRNPRWLSTFPTLPRRMNLLHHQLHNDDFLWFLFNLAPSRSSKEHVTARKSSYSFFFSSASHILALVSASQNEFIGPLAFVHVVFINYFILLHDVAENS